MESGKKSQTLREYLSKFNKLRKTKSNDVLDLSAFKEAAEEPCSESLVYGKI